ncbi:MAG TPA: TetR/AcrR family transcriptional regulator [Verrucomicrobiae bacterium]|nr:TetR/AcrR family transcriptional regulator [Verrucomicrobiae bacterium]
MTRTADERRRGELLEQILDYACRHGLGGLSLRPLAKAVGSSPRVLLYYFGSKEALVVAVIERARVRQRERIAGLKIASALPARELCSLCWRLLSDLQNEPLFRLWFEVFGLALQDRDRFPGFLDRAVNDWLDFLAGPAEGAPQWQARAWATMVLAGFRGFLLDLCATGDRARVDAAVELWLDAMDLASRTLSTGRNDAAS